MVGGRILESKIWEGKILGKKDAWRKDARGKDVGRKDVRGKDAGRKDTRGKDTGRKDTRGKDACTQGEFRVQPQVLFLRSSLLFFKDEFLMRIRGLPIQSS